MYDLTYLTTHAVLINFFVLVFTLKESFTRGSYPLKDLTVEWCLAIKQQGLFLSFFIEACGEI